MSSVCEFERKLVAMIDTAELKVEKISTPHGVNYVSLILGTIKEPDMAGAIEPQYVSEVRKGESDIDALMRRLMLADLALKVTLAPMYDVKPSVRDLLLEADTLSKTIGRDPSKLLAERMGESQVVDVYYADYEKLYRADPDLHIRLTSFAKPDQVQKAVDMGLYIKAATVVLPKGGDPLEMAYELTQNITTDWRMNPAVQGHNQQGRSSNVGDVMVLNGKPHLVAGMGFTPLDSFAPAEIQKPVNVSRRDMDDSPSP